MSSKQDLNKPFTAEEGIIHLGGIEALVRLTLDQIRLDRRRGLNNAMFISGYRGSPLGMLDANFIKQQKLLLKNNIHFVDGLNEDLAATAVWGTQMLHTVGKQKFDGVLGTWYGKAPGVDRSGDALKHANYTGTLRSGGVLALYGDDPSCKSSSLPSQSDAMFYHVGIPTLFPGDIQDILDFGLHGYQLSRISGLWAGMKVVTNVADGSGSALVDLDRLDFVTPVVEINGRPYTPEVNLGMNVRKDALDMERTLYYGRLELARQYARENKLNRVTLPNADAWLGIITAGKTYHDLRQAFLEMGLDDEALRRAGVRILKIGMLNPLQPDDIRDFARGLEEILVIEEKRPFIELFAKEILYGSANAPRIVGKRDEEGRDLLPFHGEFESDIISRALHARLSRKMKLESAEAWIRRLDDIHSRSQVSSLTRTAWYCSGCPHSTSTNVPDGSLVGAGIGCHTMAMWMDRGVVMGTHMGAEGAQWIGMQPFTETGHIFQNMGDGTYAHSGSLAVRYCAATNTNITFKILVNSHTSMTGGQEIMGAEPVRNMVAELIANGVKRVIVTTEDLSRYNAVQLAGNTQVWHRDRVIEAQKELAAIEGTTVLIHDQECAAELRRHRSRGKAVEPAAMMVINERVCEGCGDCGEKANCMSVEPVETEFGRKTRIHQPSCNKDYSCVKGFCPSFLTITPNPSPEEAAGGRKKKQIRLPALNCELPEPVFKVDPEHFGAHIMGIGGTGSVTVAATIANAARIDGKWAIGLDQTGLAQKGGAVISDIKITREQFDGANKISDGCADLYLGFDILNATDNANLAKCHPERTIAIVSTSETPTGRMVSDKNVHFPKVDRLVHSLDRITRRADNVYLNAQALAEGLFIDSMATNMFMVGVAYQAGALPLSAHAIEEAVRQSGVGVDMSLLAFRWGRMAVVDLDFVHAEIRKYEASTSTLPQVGDEARNIAANTGARGELLRLLEIRVQDLIDYQDVAYARRYASKISQVMSAEQRAAAESSALAEAAARYLHKLMAYKDEYEVARLHSDPAFLAQLDAQFPHGYTVEYNLAPPRLAKRDPETGELIKQQYGPWMLKAFRYLARLKHLRGGKWDLFGNTEERREERQAIIDYERLLDEVCDQLSRDQLALAVRLASIPDEIRGYGHVKARNVALAKAKQSQLLAEFRNPQAAAQAAAQTSAASAQAAGEVVKLG